MKREELEALAERYQGKADKAFMNYQETGMARYDREHRNNEDLADALRMAAKAADDAHKLTDLRVTLSTLADKARKLRSLQNPPGGGGFSERGRGRCPDPRPDQGGMRDAAH